MKNTVEIRGTVTAVTRIPHHKGQVVRMWVKVPNVMAEPKNYSTHVVECWSNTQEIDRGYFVNVSGSLDTIKTPSNQVTTIIKALTINVLSKTF